MTSLHLLAAIALGTGAIWALLAVWLLAERSVFDRDRTRAVRDTEALIERSAGASQLSRRRLRQVALGPRNDAAVAAAWELVRRDGRRLRTTATTGSRAARTRALAILARGRDHAAIELIHAAIQNGDAGATGSLLRLVSELAPADGDQLLLDTLIAGRLSRSRVATELEPRTPRIRRSLILLTRSSDPELRYWAVTLLCREMEHGDAAEAVRARAVDNSPNVRAGVAEALGFAPAGTAVTLLQELLIDDVFYVRSHAARAVAQTGDPLLANALLPLLADRNWWVRAAAKEGLIALGESGLMVAVAALSHPDPFARDSAVEVIAASGRPVDDVEFVRLAATALRTSDLAVA